MKLSDRWDLFTATPEFMQAAGGNDPARFSVADTTVELALDFSYSGADLRRLADTIDNVQRAWDAYNE